MNKQLVLVLAILLLAGCAGNAVPQAPVDPEPKRPPQAEIRIGGDQDEERQLPFKITAVHERQNPSTDAPYHARGGEWTYFDCQADGFPDVAFTVGLMSKSGAGNTPAAWGNAVLIVNDREAGSRFVESFGKAFSGKIPTPLKQAHVPRPLSINTAILGVGLARAEKGGFSGDRGGWTATKWFPESEGCSGEIYFNYNLAERRGEFSEKDADYGDDLVAIFASALRDGPRPERTPENDPNLTSVRPTIGEPRRLMSRSTGHDSFSPKSRFAVYQDGTTIYALSLVQPDAKPFEVVRFDHSPWTVRVLDDDLNLLVQEGVAETPGIRSSGDPMRIWWVDGKGKEKRLLRGPMKGLDLVEEPASPDQRYVAYSQWQGDAQRGARSKVLHILDRQSETSKICESNAQDLSIIGWKKVQAGFRLVALTDRWQLDKQKTSELYLADPPPVSWSARRTSIPDSKSTTPSLPTASAGSGLVRMN
jgi:hypothetical protein